MNFNWHELDNDGFLSWMVVHLLATLHLDHKNGIHNDNRIGNLHILCPNCHSQTETWGCKKR